MRVNHSLLDFANIHCIFELGMAPMELDEEDPSPESLVIVLTEPLHISVGSDKEGHMLGTVRAWDTLTVAIGRVLLIKPLLPFVVNLLLCERLIVKLVN